MARDRASIRIDMWGDGDWRDLPMGAQHLYMLLLSHPTLSYAGVAEWHPGKLAAMTHGWKAGDVLASAAVLESRGFIVVEPDTDEVLVRSFIKHDGLMKQPKLVVSMTTAFAAVASRRIQLVIAHEVQKMRDKDPEMRAWAVKQAQTVLDSRASHWAEVGPALTPGPSPTVTPALTPNSGQRLAEPTTTATTTSSKEDRDTSTKSEEQPKKSTYSKPFEEFWVMGLRKESKLAAWRAWEKLRKSGMLPDLETLRSAIQTYLRNNPDRSFQKHPASWLNAGAWEDNYTQTNGQATERKVERLK